MKDRSTASEVIEVIEVIEVFEVLGNPDLVGLILSYNKEYCHFRLTCKFMYTAVDNMPFGKKLSRANSFKPYSINEFLYNHPYVSAGMIASCFGILAGSNFILFPMLTFSSGIIGGCLSASTVTMGTEIYAAFKQDKTQILPTIKRTANILKTSFIEYLNPNIVLGAIGFGTVLTSGDACAHGFGGIIGLVNERCDDFFEQRRVFVATGVAVAGFFANRLAVRNNVNKRQEIKNEIYNEFFKNKIT